MVTLGKCKFLIIIFFDGSLLSILKILLRSCDILHTHFQFNYNCRTYIYEGEKACDVNRDVFCESIDAVAKASGGEGFAAIKITALG